MNLLDPVYLIWMVLLPLVYWHLPRIYRLHYISGLSMVAIGWYSPWSALMVLFVTTFTFVIQKQPALNKTGAITGIGGLILLFIAYKSLAGVDHDGLAEPADMTNLLHWIGFSFYSLKAIHVLLARYKGIQGPIAADEFFAYMLFLPTLLVGPIHYFQPFHSGWLQQSLRHDNLSLAIERAVWGYGKIVILGGFMVNQQLDRYISTLPVDSVHSVAYLGNLRYGLHLYFAFSGASDIAIAFAALLGFRINENFDHPFLSTNLADFWRRWHISLSDWAKHHVYTPLASLTRHHLLALLLTMMTIGLWHEFSARYLLWGAYHGLGLIVCKQWSATMSRRSWYQSVSHTRPYRLFAGFLTCQFVIIGFGITRSDSLEQIIQTTLQLFFGAT